MGAEAPVFHAPAPAPPKEAMTAGPLVPAVVSGPVSEGDDEREGEHRP